MKNKKIRAVSISLLLASMLLFASASVYTYYQIQMLGNIKAGLEDPLEAWSESSYIVWQYNSTFYASRNMSTNIIFYFGTNDDHAIQWSIDNCTAYGGSVYVKAATYTGTYNAAVVVKDKVTLVIERGALGITYTVDSGASPTILDYNHYASDYSYLIFTVGDNYYAQSGTTGAIVYSGTNASQVTNNCVEAMNSSYLGYEGGTIHFKNGYYEFTNSIVIDRGNIVLQGEGRATEFRPSSTTLDCVVLVYTPTDSPSNTHATVIRNLIFYNPNWATYNDTVAIRYHNNVSANYGISFPTVEECWFTRIDAITTDTAGFDNWTYQLVTGIRILDCTIDHPPHFFLKLWNTIDGSIQNIYATLEGGTNTVGIELYYPTALSTGLFFDDVAIIGATVGINFTNGAEGWFQSVVTDLCIDYGFHLKNSNRTMLTNTYSSTGNASCGSSYKLVNSYKCRFESCTAYNSKYGVYSCTGSSSLFNYFIGTLCIDCGTADWYSIEDYDKFTACNYIVQNASQAEASNDDWVVHGLAGTPNVVSLTVEETDARYIVQVSARNSTHFQIYLYDETAGAAETVDKTINWYACMSKHLP